MRILFTICGRAGSKGIKNKNMLQFLGYPLPLYTLSAIDVFLKENPYICSDIVLNTDSEPLIRIFNKNSLRTVHVIRRREELAGDKVSKIAVIRNSFEEMQKKKKLNYDMIVDLDITSPLRRTEDIWNLIQVQKKNMCDVTYSVTSARRNPYFNMVKKEEHGYGRVLQSPFVTRQETPCMYDMNASLYAYSPEFLSGNKEIFEGYCEIIEMMDTGILDLDRISDFELMEVIADYLYGRYGEFGKIRDNLAGFIRQPIVEEKK